MKQQTKSETIANVEAGTASVRKWLREKGFPFEMKVANTFLAHGFGALQGTYYTDPESKKSREIDVFARLNAATNDFTISLEVIVECKYSKDKPWILFYGALSSNSPLQPSEPYNKDTGDALLSNLGSCQSLSGHGFFLGPEKTAYSGTTAHQDNDDRAYKAFSAITCALRYAYYPPSFLFTALASRTIKIKVGISVIQGSLYGAELDSAGELCVTPLQWGRVRLKQGQPSQDVLLDVVTFEYLPTFLEQVKKEVEALVRDCESDAELYLNPYCQIGRFLGLSTNRDDSKLIEPETD